MIILQSLLDGFNVETPRRSAGRSKRASLQSLLDGFNVETATPTPPCSAPPCLQSLLDGFNVETVMVVGAAPHANVPAKLARWLQRRDGLPAVEAMSYRGLQSLLDGFNVETQDYGPCTSVPACPLACKACSMASTSRPAIG
jgi:hypothetical protein